MAEAGVPDVLVANEVVGAGRDRATGPMPRAASRVTVAVDDRREPREIAARARAAGVTVGVVVEVDVGMGRGGARERRRARRDRARRRGARGRRSSEASSATRVTARASRIARRASARCAPAMEPPRWRSRIGVPRRGAAGRGRVGRSHRHVRHHRRRSPAITEVQAGSYVLMDRFHEPLVSGFGFALSVAATAISVHGDLVVFDAGRKAIGGDLRPAGGAGRRGRVRVHPRGARRASATPAVRRSGSAIARRSSRVRADHREPVRRVPRRRGRARSSTRGRCVARHGEP